MNRHEAIESILEELLNCNASNRRKLTEKILKRLPDADLFSIFQDLYGDRGPTKNCRCALFDKTHRHDSTTGLCSHPDFEVVS